MVTAVMAHLLKGLCQSVDGLHVQVVGGLVQEQDVGVTKGDAGEDHARLLAAAELADGLQVMVPRQPKPAQLLPHLLRLQASLRNAPSMVSRRSHEQLIAAQLLCHHIHIDWAASVEA